LDSEGNPVTPLETESVSGIVIVAPWADNPPTLTTEQENQIIDLAFNGFMKYYYPTRWYIINNPDRYLENNPTMNTGTHLPSWYPATPAEWARSLNSTLRSTLTGGWSTGSRPLVIEDWKMPNRPGSRLRVLVIIDKNKFEARSSVGAVTEFGIPPTPVPYSSIWTDWPQISNDEIILRNLVRCPDDPGFAEQLRRVRDAVPTWASDRCIPIQYDEEPVRPLAKSDIPFFPEVIDFWNIQQNILMNSTGNRALTFSWSKVNQQLQIIKTLFTKYHNQARFFDGQVVPGIDFEAQFRTLADLVGRIGELLKLNGYVMPGKPEDEVTIWVNADYQITAIGYLQPDESLNMQPVKVGYLPYSIVEPFSDFQSIVYLTRWNELLRLVAKPPGRQYEVFINFIEDYANSHLRTYEINYCGPAHSPQARSEIEAANDLLIFGPGPVGQLVKKHGYMSPDDDRLHLSFPGLDIQNRTLQDISNRRLMLNDQAAKDEEKAEDVVKTVMNKLREIKNSEEMTIIKDVLHKVGIDRLIIEAIRCLTLNSSFNPSGMLSDIRDLVSTTSELFAGRKRPMQFNFPEITVDIPVFSVTGNLQDAIKKIILEALLGAAAALVEALMEMIREACKAAADEDDNHGVLDLSEMFETDPARNKEDLAPPLLGEPHGLNACFGTYNIPDAVGMKYLADVSEILTPTEICQLLRGTPTDEAVQAVLEFNLLYEEPPIPDNLNLSSDIISFFGCLGDMVDINSICQTLVEEMIPAVDDLCITEEQVLSAVDTFNLNNLLDMLENGVVVEVPEINLTCPTKPGYMPNPLVDRSIPQLMKAMAEILGVSFYLSVDGIKTVLLMPTTRQTGGACLAEAAGQSDRPKSGDAKIDTEIMGDIAAELTKLANAMDGNLNDVNAEIADCGIQLQDIFGGIDDLAPVISVIAELFQNLDWSGASNLGEELKEIADSNGTQLPLGMSRVFPVSFKEEVRDLVTTLDAHDENGEWLYHRWPSFGYRDHAAPRTEVENGRAQSHALISPFPSILRYRFIRNSGIASWQYDSAANLYTPVLGHEENFIKYLSLDEIESRTNKDIFWNELTGPRVLTGSYGFGLAPAYNADDLSANLGAETLNNVELHSDASPAQTAFASMVTEPFKNFLEPFPGTVADVHWDEYFEHLKDFYHPSAHMGLTKRFIDYAMANGRWTTDTIGGMLLRPDNSNCDPNDPSQVGDLMDMIGIIKDVQDEYNESSCNDNMSMEETVNKCILFGTMLLFLQISITKFYLQNVSILSAFKLEEIMGLNVVRDFITTTTFGFVSRFLKKANPALENSMGAFSNLFGQEANNWMARKLARGTALEEDVLRALEIDPTAADLDAQLLNNNNAIKYMIAWRMKRCAAPLANVIANPSARSIENVFVKDVIGFSDPFTRHTESPSVTTAMASTPSNRPLWALYLNQSLKNIENLLGYGCFKIEPWITWENATSNDEEDIELEVSEDPGEKIIITPNVPGSAPLRTLIKAHREALSQTGASSLAAQTEATLFHIALAGLTLQEAKTEYRLVYYPPLESVSETNDKLNTLGKIFDTGLLPADAAADPWPAADQGRDAALNKEKAFMPISLGNTMSSTTTTTTNTHMTHGGIGTPWHLPTFPNLQSPDWIRDGCIAGMASEDWEYDPDTGQFGPNLQAPGASAAAWYPGFCVATPPPLEAPIIEVVDPEADPNEPGGAVEETIQLEAVWSWKNDLHGDPNVYLEDRRGDMTDPGGGGLFSPGGSDPQALGGPALQPSARGDGIPDILQTFTSDGMHDELISVADAQATQIGHWVAEPLDDWLETTTETEVWLEKDSNYITTSIPIMTFESEQLGDLIFGEPYVFEQAGLAKNTGDIGDPHSLRSHYSAFLNSPDYPKFEYFFSKIINKDSAFVALLMNNFCQTELKFSTGMEDLFSDTIVGAAGLFMTTLEIGARESGIAPDRAVGLPGVQEPAGGSPSYINVRSFILKALREMPLHVLKAVCEMLDPHAIITKIIKDISGQVINQSIDAMEMGITIAEETAPQPIATILKALEVNPEAFVQLAFCELNKAMRPHSDDNMPDQCLEFGDMSFSDPFNEISPFPTFTLKGINLAGTIPGIFMAPPGPFGIAYLIIRAILESINLEPPARPGAPENSSC